MPAGGKSTFTTNLTVKGGDRLGLVTIGSMPMVYDTSSAKDVVGLASCGTMVGFKVGTGTSCTITKDTGDRMNVAATLKPAG